MPTTPQRLAAPTDKTRAPTDLPGLLFPAPDGPRLVEVLAALERVLATGRVAAVGLCGTWHPGAGSAAPLRQPLTDLLAGWG